MKLITKNTDYAIRALLYLAEQNGDFLASRTIAEKNHIPLMFMRRILLSLTQAGIVESREGMAGGIRLTRKPKQILIIEIIRIFQGAVLISQCLSRKKVCPYIQHCPLRKELKRIEKKLIQEFTNLTLDKMVPKTAKLKTAIY